MEELVILKL